MVKKIFKDTLIDQSIYWLTSLFTIIVICVLIDVIFQNKITFDMTMIGLFALFLCKYFTWIFIEVISLKLYALISPISHEEIISYLTFFIIMILDFYLGSGFYGFIRSWIFFMKYEGIILIAGTGMIGFLIYQILYAKELFV